MGKDDCLPISFPSGLFPSPCWHWGGFFPWVSGLGGPAWQQCPQWSPSDLAECVLGRTSTTKGLFHLSNVYINLLICPGAIKHSSPKGKEIIPLLFLCISSHLLWVLSADRAESHAMAPALVLHQHQRCVFPLWLVWVIWI